MLGNLADIVSFSRHLVHWARRKLEMSAKKCVYVCVYVRISDIGRVKIGYSVSRLCSNPLSLLRENGSGNSLNLLNSFHHTPKHSYWLMRVPTHSPKMPGNLTADPWPNQPSEERPFYFRKHPLSKQIAFQEYLTWEMSAMGGKLCLSQFF